MPLIFQQDINEFAKIGIWELKEAEIFFSDILTFRSIAHNNRRLQHLAGRYLLSILYPSFPLDKIILSECGKPILLDCSFYFSISHTTEYVAAIVSTKMNVGIDVEKVSPKIKGIMPRILSASDFLVLENQNWAMDGQAETLMWCIKETVYKWGGERNVSFQNDINIIKIENDKKVSTVIFCRKIPYNLILNYQYVKSHCVVWTLGEV
jgi:phosphopantetheinyl transferase